MTRDEMVALAWIELKLQTFNCGVCGRTWISGRSQAAIFHQCLRPRQAMTWHRGVEETNAVRNRQWAERALGMNPVGTAIETALGERAWLDPDPTPEDRP